MINKKLIKQLFWLAPFLSFLFGYFLLSVFLNKKQIETPSLIGKKLEEGLALASAKGLNIRLIREQEEADLPAGVVVEQIPGPDQNIRPNQHIFVVVSKKPLTPKVPNLIGTPCADITKQLSHLGIQHKTFRIPSAYPKDLCVAQIPSAGTFLTDSKVAIYVSAGKSPLFVVPDFRGLALVAVKAFLEKEKIVIEVFSKNGKTYVSEEKITDQRPIPGSIVDLSKPLFVQLQVE